MKLSDFDYYLPKELIAQYPLKMRDEARLLVLHRVKGEIEHRTFKDIREYFFAEDQLVLNDTKVLPARLIGKRLSGGRVEILLLGHKEKFNYSALMKPARLKTGERIIFNGGRIFCNIISRSEVSFDSLDKNEVYGLGVMPLPPYIKRIPEELDNVYYQTVYARKEGAIASPTAGLHFTDQLIKEIQDTGVNVSYVTLHIGQGTFKPVKSEDVREHKMDKEYYEISEDTIEMLKSTRDGNGRIFAVGTTSCRALETYSINKEKSGYTDLFIYPGYKFQAVDCLLTNFHLPRTTLFMLIAAFAGEKIVRKAYQEAIDNNYRFYSYGDAMLII